MIWVLGIDFSQFALKCLERFHGFNHAALGFGVLVDMVDEVSDRGRERGKLHGHRSGRFELVRMMRRDEVEGSEVEDCDTLNATARHTASPRTVGGQGDLRRTDVIMEKITNEKMKFAA